MTNIYCKDQLYTGQQPTLHLQSYNNNYNLYYHYSIDNIIRICSHQHHSVSKNRKVCMNIYVILYLIIIYLIINISIGYCIIIMSCTNLTCGWIVQSVVSYTPFTLGPRTVLEQFLGLM